MIGNDHARFWIGGGGSNPFADHSDVMVVVALDEMRAEATVVILLGGTARNIYLCLKCC